MLSGNQTLQVSHQSKILKNQKLSSGNDKLSSENDKLSSGKQAVRIERESYSKEYQKTKEAYQKLNPTLRQHTSDELNSKVSTLSPVVRAKLKKNNIAPAEYANFLLSREKIR